MSEVVRKLLETLDKKALTAEDIHREFEGLDYKTRERWAIGKWVSVETVTALLQKVFREKVMVSRKQLEEEKKEALEHVGFWRMAKQNDNSPPFSNEQVIARAKVCWIEELLAGSVEEGSK